MAVPVPNLNKAKVGDTTINTSNFNKIVSAVNKSNRVSVDGSSVDYESEDGVIKSSLPRNTILPKHPFKIETQNPTTLAVYKGDWIRNQTGVTLSASDTATQDEHNDEILLIKLADFTGTPAEDTDFYVYVELGANVDSTTNTYDYGLIPGQLTVLVDSDGAEAGVRTPEEANTLITSGANIRDFWIKTKEVIGTVQLGTSGGDFWIKSINQSIDIDIEDIQIIPDSLNLSYNGDPRDAVPYNNARWSIEYNPHLEASATGTIHFGEFQLRHINECAGEESYGIPYFESFTDNDGTDEGPGGDMYWASIDSKYYPDGDAASGGADSLYKTLDIVVDTDENNKPNTGNWSARGNSFKYVTLHNCVETTYKDSSSICYYEAGDRDIFSSGNRTQGELKWAVIDSTEYRSSGTPQKSLEVVAGSESYDLAYNIVQLNDFDSTVSESLGNSDLMLFKQLVGSEYVLKYADQDAVNDWVNVAATNVTCEAVWDCIEGSLNFEHINLTDIAAGGYAKRDHTNHWCNPTTVDGVNSANLGTYEVNYGYSIGNENKNLVIDLEKQQIYPRNAVHPTRQWQAYGYWIFEEGAADYTDAYLNSPFRVEGGSEFWCGMSVGTKNGNSSGEGLYAGWFHELHGVNYDDRNTYSRKYVTIIDNVADIALYAYNVSFEASLALVDKAAYFTDGTAEVSLCYGSNVAGAFTDGTITADLCDGTYSLNANDVINTSEQYYVDGTQVVTTQQAAVNDAAVTASAVGAGGADSDGTARTEIDKLVTDVTDVKDQLNDLLVKLRTHGLIAT